MQSRVPAPEAAGCYGVGRKEASLKPNCTPTLGHLAPTPHPAKKHSLKKHIFQFHKQPLDLALAPNFYKPLALQSVPGLRAVCPSPGHPHPCASMPLPSLEPTLNSELPLSFLPLPSGPLERFETWGRWAQGKDWIGADGRAVGQCLQPLLIGSPACWNADGF